MRTFKVGDRVKITPTTKLGWNHAGRMEASIGMVGKIMSGTGPYEVLFESTDCDTQGCRVFWSYYPEDLVKHTKFKGNKQ